MFLLPLVLARWAEVKAMIVAPVRCLRHAERCWKPTTLFHSRIHWKISLPSCFRPELGLSVARHLQRSPVREVGKQETTACISRVGGMVSIYLTNVCSLALVSQGKGTMIGVTLDSPSDSWVPTHGATSVPSMPAFSGNPILLCFFVTLKLMSCATVLQKISNLNSRLFSRQTGIGLPSLLP